MRRNAIKYLFGGNRTTSAASKSGGSTSRWGHYEGSRELQLTVDDGLSIGRLHLQVNARCVVSENRGGNLGFVDFVPDWAEEIGRVDVGLTHQAQTIVPSIVLYLLCESRDRPATPSPRG